MQQLATETFQMEDSNIDEINVPMNVLIFLFFSYFFLSFLSVKLHAEVAFYDTTSSLPIIYQDTWSP